MSEFEQSCVDPFADLGRIQGQKPTKEIKKKARISIDEEDAFMAALTEAVPQEIECKLSPKSDHEERRVNNVEAICDPDVGSECQYPVPVDDDIVTQCAPRDFEVVKVPAVTNHSGSND